MVPGYGEVSYNGYTFPATYEMKLECEPDYIPGTEIVRYYVNTLIVSFIVTTELATFTNAAESVDDEMQAIRLALQEPRRALAFTYQGSGFRTAITSGTGANTDDINGGPLPQVNSWEPIGTNAAARVSWSVIFYTTYCLNESGNFNDLASYTTSHLFSISEEGTARVTRSFEALKKHKAIGFQPNNIAHIDMDRELAIFIPNLPLGFKRVKQSYSISPNGRKLTGEVVDEEEASNNATFPYSIKVTADHSLESSLTPSGQLSGGAFMSWDNDISATIQLAPGYTSSVAYQIFLWILYQRFYRLRASATGKNEQGYFKNVEERNILTHLKMQESLYSRSHSFQAKYFGVYNLARLFNQSGLFTPVRTAVDANGLYPWDNGYVGNQATEWILYRTTVSDTVHGPFGYRRAGIDPSQAFILYDPCASLYQNIGANPNMVATSPSGPVIPVYHPSVSQSTPAPIYNQGTSNYLQYKNNFKIIEKTRVYPLGIQDNTPDIRSYKGTSSAELGTINSGNPLEGSFSVNGKTVSGSGAPQETAYAGIGGGSVFTLNVRGFAIRHGAPAPCPAVVQFAGQPVKRVGNPVYESRQVSEGHAPLYVTRWDIDYLIPFEISGNIFGSVSGNVFNNDFLESAV